MNPVLLQKQLKENSADLQDFYKDLKSWGEEMKRKEQPQDNKKPSIVTKKKHKSITNGNKLAQGDVIKTKIATTDYTAWEKFDADAECEKIDQNESDESELTDEIDEELRDKAFLEKEKGNKLVKNQKWAEAITCYSKAIEYYSFDPIFYANRALCHLKLNQMFEAEKDCTMSLKLDNNYVKAYQRRAAARESLNELENAKSDLLRVLELEPNNKESIKALDNLRKKNVTVTDQRPLSKFSASRKNQIKQPELNKSQIIDDSKPVLQWPSGDDVILVKAVNKPPHMRSKKTLMRVKINEMSNKIEDQAEIVAVKDKVVERCELVSKEVKNSSNISIISGDDLCVPKTSVQFYSCWKQFNIKMKYKYLKLIGPEKIPDIFKESIESNIFSEILEVLVECYITNREPVYEFLNCLTTMKRFSALVMFFTSKDENNLWKLIDHIKNVENKSKYDVEKLIDSYELCTK